MVNTAGAPPWMVPVGGVTISPCMALLPNVMVLVAVLISVVPSLREKVNVVLVAPVQLTSPNMIT